MRSTLAPRLPPRRSLVRACARIGTLGLALLGLLPIALSVVLRLPWVNALLVAETRHLIAGFGVRANYDVALHLWPLSAELRDVVVESTDGGEPALTADRVYVRPRFFSLLAGKPSIDDISIDAPRVRVVLRGRRIENLGIELPESDDSPSEPFHAPFAALALSDAWVDFTLVPEPGSGVPALHAELQHADIDLLAMRGLPDEGSSFDAGLRATRLAVETERTPDDSLVPVVDDDQLCELEARVSFSQTGRIAVRRLEAHGAVDTAGERGSFPGCDLAHDDPRRLDVSIGHLQIDLPKAGAASALPEASGRVEVRVPLVALNRIPGLPAFAGWFSLQADVDYDPAQRLPDVKGEFHIESLGIDGYRVIEDATGAFLLDDDIVQVPALEVHVSRGEAHITDVEVRPFEPGIPLKAEAHIEGASFLALMSDLGVSAHPHVNWDLDRVDVTNFGGPLLPLKLEGDVSASTSNFAVYDKAVDAPDTTRIIGFPSANLTTAVRITAESLDFSQVMLSVADSHVDGAFVSIGFSERLLVDAPEATVKLENIGPLGSLPIGGTARVAVRVSGEFGAPRLVGEGSVEDFVLAGLPLGTVEAVHAELDGMILNLQNARAVKGESSYSVPYARLDFGTAANVDVEADVDTSHLRLGDLFSVFELQGDPRFEDLDAVLSGHVRTRIVLGGPEDRCGEGMIDLSGAVDATALSLFGETFDSAHAELDFDWTDRAAGLRGASLRARTVSLVKSRRADGSPFGTVLGSVSLQHGGQLGVNAVYEGVPLSKLDALGVLGARVAGSASGVVSVAGDLEAFVVDASVNVTPVRIDSALFGSSDLAVRFTHAPPPSTVVRTTRCGLPITQEFDLARYRVESQKKQGDIQVSGSLLGGQVRLDGFTMTREPLPHYSGKLEVVKLDAAKLVEIVAPSQSSAFDEEVPHLAGEVSGQLEFDVPSGDLAQARAEFRPGIVRFDYAGQAVSLQFPEGPIRVAADQLDIPGAVVSLQTVAGLGASFAARGRIRKLTTERELDFGAALQPIDLQILRTISPKIQRATGRLVGGVRVQGTLDSPSITGELSVRDAAFTVLGLPSPITDLNFDLRATDAEARIVGARAKFAGGDVSFGARMPLRGGTVGFLDAQLTGRNLHLTPAAGLRASLDCDLTLSGDMFATGLNARLPRIGGSVVLSAFEYSRPVNLELSQSLAGGAKRTAVETYDPQGDYVALDINVRAKTPLRVKNNLADFQLAIEGDGLTVTGTNQRIGLRGELSAVTGGRLRFLSNEFELRQASIRFDDPTRIQPYVDLLAVTEYRRAATQTAAGSGRASGTWKISLHAYGPADDLQLDMSSEPSLTREDISLLLTVGLTKAETDSLGSNALSVFAYEAAGTATGADRALKRVIPIDDFRFGSAYSPRTGRSEPNFTVGKRISKDVTAAVTSGFTEERQQRTTVEWRLSRQTSVQAGYDNINNISATGAGNVGFDVRWRLEFE